MESMSEQERYKQGCLSRELGEIALPEVVEPPKKSEIPIENLRFYD